MRPNRLAAPAAAMLVAVSLSGCFGGKSEAGPEGAERRPVGSPEGSADRRAPELDDWQLAFMHRPEGAAEPDLYVANADGSDLVRLDELRGDEQTPNWSPDGRRVAIRWVPRDYDDTPLLIIDTETSGSSISPSEPASGGSLLPGRRTASGW